MEESISQGIRRRIRQGEADIGHNIEDQERQQKNYNILPAPVQAMHRRDRKEQPDDGKRNNIFGLVAADTPERETN